MKRYKNYIILFLGIAIFYFASRLVNLTDLPIFTDEAIYIRWAQIANKDASWRFISLTDGKQPLFVWGAMVLLRFISDPLLAGRLVSVIAGFFSMIGIGVLGRELFKSGKVGLFASFLYLVYPFALVYDRMALMDSMTAMFYIWSLYLGVLLVRTLRLDVALILGMVLGGGYLTKSSGLISILLLPTTLILFDWKEKNVKLRLAKWTGLAGISAVLSQIYYSVLRLSPWFHMIAKKNTTFVFTKKEWLEQPFRFFWGNLRGELDWVVSYLTYPLVLLVLFSLFLIWKHWREKTLLFVWFALPILALANFGKVLYPRFVLFMSMPLLVLAAWTLEYLWKKIANKFLLLASCFLLLFYPLYFDGKILFSTLTAPLPRSDRNQYIHDWPSGWGIREAVDILERESEDQKITVYTEGNFGLLPYGIEIYLVENPNIEIIGLWPPPDIYTKGMEKKITEKPVYYISNQSDYLPVGWRGEIVEEWAKGTNEQKKLRLWRLHKNESKD